MIKPDRIVLAKDEFGDNLWKVVGQQLEILTKAGYEVLVTNDEPAFDIICLEFCYDPRRGYGNDCFLFVTDDEAEDIICARSVEDLPDEDDPCTCGCTCGCCE